jgi:hypothetical protein
MDFLIEAEEDTRLDVSSPLSVTIGCFLKGTFLAPSCETLQFGYSAEFFNLVGRGRSPLH